MDEMWRVSQERERERDAAEERLLDPRRERDAAEERRWCWDSKKFSRGKKGIKKPFWCVQKARDRHLFS